MFCVHLFILKAVNYFQEKETNYCRTGGGVHFSIDNSQVNFPNQSKSKSEGRIFFRDGLL